VRSRGRSSPLPEHPPATLVSGRRAASAGSRSPGVGELGGHTRRCWPGRRGCPARPGGEQSTLETVARPRTAPRRSPGPLQASFHRGAGRLRARGPPQRRGKVPRGTGAALAARDPRRGLAGTGGGCFPSPTQQSEAKEEDSIPGI